MEVNNQQNTTLNFLRTVLLGLCANFNERNMPKGDWSCQFRSEYYYELKALRGKTFRFTTLQKLPLSGVISDEIGSLKGTGVAFDLINEIQEKVGFYYNITLPKENVIGNENAGIIQMLINGEVDMAVAFVPMMQIFKEKISFSSALAEFEWVLFMARPSASASGSGLLAPFQGTVWILILLSLIVAGPSMYLIVYLRIKFSEKKVSKNKIYPLSTCFWFVYGALMKQGSTLSPSSDSSRLFFATWWIFITILTSFYTANLTAFLTLSQFTLTIQTTKDIYSHRRHWMADGGGFEETLIANDNSFDYLKETIPKYGQYVTDSVEQRLKRVMKGEIYVTEKRHAEVLMMRDYLNKTRSRIPETKRCTFVVTPKPFLTKPVGFAYKKDSRLKKLFDPMLTYLVSGGIIAHLLDEGLPLTSVCPLNLANRERKLLNTDLITTYKVVAVGFGSASAVFLGEVIYRCFTKKGKEKTIVVSSKKIENIEPPLSEVILIDENKSKSLSSDNFVISQYYKEIMPYRYSKDRFIDAEKYIGLNSSQKQSSSLLSEPLPQLSAIFGPSNGLKMENKPACRFGSKCYRKNPHHFIAYSHVPDKKNIKAKFKVKEKNSERWESRVKETQDMTPNTEDKNEPEVAVNSIISENEILKTHNEFYIINALFKVQMPPDFYSFYEFYKSLEKNQSFECCGLKLVGPFDVLAGKIQHLMEPEISLLHWRFYYDPPEFQTVLTSESEFHIGYWRDDPGELPVCLASNTADKDCIFKVEAENIFGSVLKYLRALLKISNSNKKMRIKKLELALCEWAKKNKFSLEKNSKNILLREKKIVTKTFHKMGLIVPIEEKSGIGYRPLMETEEKLKSICSSIMSATESEREIFWEKLQPLITAANIANDECDFGNSLELGIDLFCMGSHIFHDAVEHLLTTAYSLLNRTGFEEIIKAHLKNRKKGKDLSVF